MNSPQDNDIDSTRADRNKQQGHRPTILPWSGSMTSRAVTCSKCAKSVALLQIENKLNETG
jgi:hypothetical protein